MDNNGRQSVVLHASLMPFFMMLCQPESRGILLYRVNHNISIFFPGRERHIYHFVFRLLRIEVFIRLQQVSRALYYMNLFRSIKIYISFLSVDKIALDFNAVMFQFIIEYWKIAF